MSPRRALSVTAFVLLATIYGCNDSNFNADSKKGSREDVPHAVDKVLNLSCDEAGGVAKLETKVSGTERTFVTVKGEFCGIGEIEQEASELSVLFLLDISGSMRTNDPQEGSGCGRLSAVEAILSQLAKQSDNAKISVGGVTFGDDAELAIALSDLEQFRSSVSSNLICSSLGGGTNYEDAFAKAKETLANQSGAKYIYFISDGMPTVSSAGSGSFSGGSLEESFKESVEAGKRTAVELRDELENLTLNAIYLGNTDITFGGAVDIGDFDPESYLSEITGSKDRVRVVTNADDLATEIVTFDPPEAIDLEESSVKGELLAASFGNRSVKIKSFQKHPSVPGRWLFESEPIVLFGNHGQQTANKISFEVTASDGTVKRAEVLVDFEAYNQF